MSGEREIRYRFRTNWRGKLILQVTDWYRDWNDYGCNVVYRWRDARPEDLLDVDLHKLLRGKE